MLLHCFFNVTGFETLLKRQSEAPFLAVYLSFEPSFSEADPTPHSFLIWTSITMATAEALKYSGQA